VLADTPYVAATADLRFIFARPKPQPQNGTTGPAAPVAVKPSGDPADADPQYTLCAEPSPDIAKAISDAITASANATVDGLKALGGTGASASLTPAISSSQNSAIAEVGRRLATTQLLRDGVYRLCEAYANGAITRDEYALVLSRYGDTMVTLLAIEGLTGMSTTQTAATASSAASTADAASGAGGAGAGDKGKTTDPPKGTTGDSKGKSAPQGSITPDNAHQSATQGVASERNNAAGKQVADPNGGSATPPADLKAVLQRISYLTNSPRLIPTATAVAPAAPGAPAVAASTPPAHGHTVHPPAKKGTTTPPSGASAPTGASQPKSNDAGDDKAAIANAVVQLQSNYLRQSAYAPLVVLCTEVLGLVEDSLLNPTSAEAKGANPAAASSAASASSPGKPSVTALVNTCSSIMMSYAKAANVKLQAPAAAVPASAVP
jgi:hypothetical protein